jgi:hypothetical protein
MNPCEMETGLGVSHAKVDYDSRKTDKCIVDVNLDLNHDATKVCNLIYDNVCGLNDCVTVPYNSIDLSLFYNNALSSMTKIWRNFAEKLIHWN